MPGRILRVNPKRPKQEVISEAIAVIKKGGLIALPTETVYGLAADIFNKTALKKVFEVKKRPLSFGLIVGVREIKDFYKLCEDIPDWVLKIIKTYSPGPLTYILKKKRIVSPLITGGKEGIALRIPRPLLVREIIKKSQTFITLTSANTHNRPSPLTAEDVKKDLGEKIDLILDGGKTEIGKESTIIDFTLTPPRVLREGAISLQELKRIIPAIITQSDCAG